MKTRNRFIALLLAGTMIFSLAACGQQNNEETKDAQASASTSDNTEAAESTEEVEENPYPEWFNTEGDVPLVKDGHEKTLSVYMRIPDGVADTTQTWFYKFVTEALNINLELTTFNNANASEFLNLAFASDELPDIIIGAGLGSSSMVRYGASEGQIIDLAPYINEYYMPKLTALYEENPAYKANVTDSEGHVWSFGSIADGTFCEQLNRMFNNQALLDELNIPQPETLDEFLEACRTIKAAYPDMYPIGGAYNGENPMAYILNAFGYVGNGNIGTSICLRNGEVVLPVADEEAYGEFLTFMNTLYEEELIHPDFFTMDYDTQKAIMVEGKNAYYTQAPFLFVENYFDWWSPNPLTSNWNETAQWPMNSSATNAGQVVITSHCEDVELAVRFCDWFYTYENYRISTVGMMETYPNFEEYAYDGYSGRRVGEDGMTVDHVDMLEEPDKYATNNEYVDQMVHMWNYGIIGYTTGAGTTIESCGEPYRYDMYKEAALEVNSNPVETRYNTFNGQYHFMFAMEYGLGQYVTTEVFPGYAYLDADTVEEVRTLQVPILEYAKQETAKFITGARPLEELDDYFAELDKLGAEDYVKIYADYYAASK